MQHHASSSDIHVFLSSEDARRALEDCLADEPEWARPASHRRSRTLWREFLAELTL